MISLETLTTMLDDVYQITKIPICLLDEQYCILKQPTSFYPLSSDVYQLIRSTTMPNRGILDIYLSESILTMFIPYQDHSIHSICIGPLILPKISGYQRVEDIPFLYQLQTKQKLQEYLKNIASFDDVTFSYIQLFYRFLKDELLTIQDIRAILHQNKQSENDLSVSEVIIQKRETEHQVYTYLEEQKFLQFIKNGDNLSARMVATQLISNENELLSDDEFQSKKYNLVSAISLITRSVIEVGAKLEDSYATSDTYIRKIDRTRTQAQLHEVFMNCIIDFCSLVKKNSKRDFPYWIRNLMEYIDQNLHKELSLSQLSSYLHMSPTYISVQFKKVTGESITDYINRKKIEESKYLLRYTEMNILEVAANLNYASQSYFTKLFRKHANMLPSEYKNKFAR